MGAFKPASEIERQRLEWGIFAPVSSPRDGLQGIVTIEATFLPGKCHDFHRHPGQEEVIYVLEGELEQWVETERATLRAGDAVVIPAVRRARFLQRRRCAGEDPRHPLAGGGRGRLRGRGPVGRAAVHVAPERLMQAVRVHEGGELRYEEAPDPQRRWGRGRGRAAHRRPQPARPARQPRRLSLPAAVDPRFRRCRGAARHGRRGRDPALALVGAGRGGARAGLSDPGRPARRHLRRAGRGPRGEPLSEARQALLGGGRGVPARRAHRVPRALPAGRPEGGGDGARARRRQRGVDLRRPARGPGRSARPRHLLVAGEGRAGGGARGGDRCALHRGRLGGGGARADRRSRRRARARLGRLDLARVAAGGLPRRPRGRLRGDGRNRGDARGAAALPPVALSARARRWGARTTSAGCSRCSRRAPGARCSTPSSRLPTRSRRTSDSRAPITSARSSSRAAELLLLGRPVGAAGRLPPRRHRSWPPLSQAGRGAAGRPLPHRLASTSAAMGAPAGSRPGTSTPTSPTSSTPQTGTGSSAPTG